MDSMPCAEANEVFLAVEAVGEVVARVDGGGHLAAMGTEEAEGAFAHFRRRRQCATK